MIYTIVIYNDDRTPKEIISFDSVEGASKTLSATVTANTVEDGYEIADGMVVDPLKMSIKAVGTSYNIFDDSNEMIWNGRGFSKKSGVSGEMGNHILLEKKLLNLIQGKQVFTLFRTEENSFKQDVNAKHQELGKTIIDVYQNCVLTEATVDENKGVSGALFFDLKFTQIRYARTVVEDLTKEQQQRRLTPMKGQPTSTSTGSKTEKSDGSTPSITETPIDPVSKKAPPVNPDEAKNKAAVKVEEDIQKTLDAKIKAIQGVISGK